MKLLAIERDRYVVFVGGTPQPARCPLTVPGLVGVARPLGHARVNCRSGPPASSPLTA